MCGPPDRVKACIFSMHLSSTPHLHKKSDSKAMSPSWCMISRSRVPYHGLRVQAAPSAACFDYLHICGLSKMPVETLTTQSPPDLNRLSTSMDRPIGHSFGGGRIPLKESNDVSLLSVPWHW